jgi:hypothetical protein
MNGASQGTIIRVNIAGQKIVLNYKRWETESGVSLTFISSVFKQAEQ